MRANNMTFRCIFSPRPTYVQDAERPGMYSYQPDVRCFEGADYIAAHQPITVIGFFSPSTMNPIPASDKPLLQQHIHYQSFILFDVDEGRPEWPSMDFYASDQNSSTNLAVGCDKQPRQDGVAGRFFCPPAPSPPTPPSR